jgi:hypothetical protein
MPPAYYYGLYALYLATAGVFIIAQNRRPQATFAWMLLFLGFPGFGVLVYVLFGRDRKPFRRSQKLARQNLLKDLSRVLSHLRGQHEQALNQMEEEGAPAGRSPSSCATQPAQHSRSRTVGYPPECGARLLQSHE